MTTAKTPIKTSAGASLFDMGDGVAWLEFHLPVAGKDVTEMLAFSVEEVERNWNGLVIGHKGSDFCVGADLPWLLEKIENKKWTDIEAATADLQTALQQLKYCQRPVVAAPRGKAVGRGACILMHSHHVRLAADTFIGLPEILVGLVPASGGLKELTARSVENLPQDVTIDCLPLFKKVHETICMAKISKNGLEGKRLGYLRNVDAISLNDNKLLTEAKKTVLFMSETGFGAPTPTGIKISGRTGYAAMQMNTYFLQQGGFITEYSAHVANKAAYVISGGNLPANAVVDEQYLLDLEREAFVQLCGEPKTQERLRHLLTQGKPLFN